MSTKENKTSSCKGNGTTTCKLYPYVDDSNGKLAIVYACAAHQKENQTWLGDVKRLAITNLKKL